MATQLTLEELISAIRSDASVEELKRMVGPSDEEIAAAKARLERIDVLDAKCEWDSMAPSLSAQQARERREPLVRDQGAYEAKYC